MKIYGDPRWPPFGDHDVITMCVMSSFPIAVLKGNIFGRTIYPLSLIVLVFILAKLWYRLGGGGGVDYHETNPFSWQREELNLGPDCLDKPVPL